MKKAFVLLLVSQFFVANAQDSSLMQYLKTIKADELTEHVRILSSEEYEGRGTGERGQHLASQYLKEQFVLMNLEGPSPTGDPYFQEFQLVTGGVQGLEIVNGEDTLTTNSHLAVIGKIAATKGEYDIIFVGYGIDDEKYSDYEDIDVSGKIVAYLAGEPKTKNGKYLLSDSYLPEYNDNGKTKTKIALSKGAIAAIRINPDQEQVKKMVSMLQKFKGRGMWSLIQDNPQESEITAVIHVGIEDAVKLFSVEQSTLDKSIKKLKNRKKNATPLESHVSIQTNQGEERIDTENVVAFLPGTELKDEVVVITAHFDHLGKRKDNIYYGADDNATGTAAVIEIAEAFAEMARAGMKPKRSILFMPVSGEERGLLGSRYYVRNPIFPLKSTVATINMDMIGRSDDSHLDNPNYVYVYLSDTANSELFKKVINAAKYVEGNLRPEYKYITDRKSSIGGSDHASFEEFDIPVLYFYCGIHEDYHSPNDTWDKIEYEKLTAITRMVFTSAWNIANK